MNMIGLEIARTK